MLVLFYRFLTIILLILIGGGIGYGLSYSQTEKWKVTAQFDLPTIPNLGNYYSLSSTYHFLNTNNQNVQQESVLNQVYNEFKRNLTSIDLLKHYLSQSEIVKLKAQVEHKSVAMISNQLVTQFSFNQDSTDDFSLVLENPEDAQKLVNEFILLANQQARDKLNADLIAKWKVLFQQIKQADELNLGANKQDWGAKLQMMRSVQPLDNLLTTYRLVKSPSIPLKAESPDRLLWSIIGALIGLFIGIILSFAIKYKQSSSNTKLLE